VAKLLLSLNHALLHQSRCYFGGGTAIVMLLGEYRESRDVDFLCASATGYRMLRSAAFDSGLAGLFDKPPKALSELRADQYGLRAILSAAGTPIKFEIIREARIELGGQVEPRLRVPVLSRENLYAEKLLANADRGRDRSMLSRDFIDLTAMQPHWGPVPRSALAKAQAAYGAATITSALRESRRLLRDKGYREKCLSELDVERWVRDAVEAALSAPRRAVVRES
jgi:hypothetical protein